MNWKSFLGLAPNTSAIEGEHHLTSRSGDLLSALVFLGVAASFLAVLGKCGWMQLVEEEQWTFTQQQTQSQTRHSTITRGKILDKNGQVLAQDRIRYRVAIDPFSAAKVVSNETGVEGLQRAIQGAEVEDRSEDRRDRSSK
ncbi:MAG TPA: hypothetical protein EYQ08_05645 [Planctomycetes bacterium]|nr:hypothetical protein [Planctomycetota bacterium]